MPAPLGRLIPGIVAEAYRRRGFTEPALLTGWRAIVGDEAGDRSVPIKVAFPRGSRTAGTLHVRVEGAYATELQHNAPRIVERINGFYGYAAIARLALHQGPVERKAGQPGGSEAGCRPAPDRRGDRQPRAAGGAVKGSALRSGPAPNRADSPERPTPPARQDAGR